MTTVPTNKAPFLLQPFIVKKKSKPQSLQQESLQNQKKQIRILNAIFQTNLNKFVRKNKECFNGGIELPINKVLFTNQEMINNKNIKENFQKYSDRLVKVMLVKNNFIYKNCQEFDQEMNTKNNPYSEKNNSEEDQNVNKIVCYDSQTSLQNEVNSLLRNKSNTQKSAYENPQKSIEKSQNYQSQKYRPMSATFQRNSLSPKKVNNEAKFFNRPLSSFTASKQFKKKDSILLKNVDVDKAVYINQNPKRKTPLSRLSMGAGFNQFQKYEEEEVYIRKKIAPHNQLLKQGRFLRSSQLFQKKNEKNSVFKKFNSTYNSKNDYQNYIQRQKLQNKIMMVNTVLAFNLNQTQGYKPKSKCCW